jgi:RNA polymerase subunit RPABC4/transcription elongation factor Spt4
MDRRSKWIAFVLVVASVVVIGCLLLALLLPALGWGAWGSNAPQMRGGRMGGMCPWCGGTGYQTPWGSVAGVVMMLFVVALPLALIALLIVGGVWLARSAKSTPARRDESLACPSCGREVEPGWKACPYCGERLAE